MKRSSIGVLTMVAIMVSMVWGGSLSHATTSFVHPGILNNQAEYDLIKTKVAAKVNPWYTAYQQLQNALSYSPQAVSTLSDATLSQFHQDGAAAYASALRWVAAGDVQHRDKAKQILNAWAYKLTSIGSDVLQSGYWSFNSAPGKFIYAAEIMKHTSSGWSSADQSKFAAMLKLILPRLLATDTSSSDKWKKSNSAAMATHVRMAAGVHLDNGALFDQAVNEARSMIRFYIGTHGNPVPTGFTYETCRYKGDLGTLNGGDIQHVQYGLGPLVQAAEIAKKQGTHLYSYSDSSDGASLLTALRYHAPFVGKTSAATWPCQIPLNQISTWYHMPWQMAYNHYKDTTVKSVVTRFASPSYMTGPYHSITTGASYEMLTHSYSGLVSAPLASPTNLRVTEVTP